MKFDEMTVEELEARQLELGLAPVDESVSTEEIEARASEMEAIKA